MMEPKVFARLIIWEIEEYWDFPILELVAATAVFSILNWSSAFITSEFRYRILGSMGTGSTMFYMSFFLCLTAGVVFSHTFAGSISKDETKMLLSYPVKKWWLLLSKFITNLFMFFIIYAAATFINIPLLALSPFEPMLYVTFASIFIQLTFLCSIAMTLSLMLKNEVASILTSILLFLGIEAFAANRNNILSFIVRHDIIFRFFEQIFHNITTGVVPQDFLIALALPVLVSILLLTLSFLYFNYVMELD
jgi:ABC-type transport system involved in multi-copper enzyme maturation permease subunit